MLGLIVVRPLVPVCFQAITPKLLDLWCVEFRFFSNFEVPGFDYYGFWAGKAENYIYFLIKLCLATRVLVQSSKNRVFLTKIALSPFCWDFSIYVALELPIFIKIG